MSIPENLIDYIDYTISFIDNNSSDWLIIRKELIKILPPELRSLFKRRHYSSKLTQLVDLDYKVISYWEEKTGTSLFIDKTKLHPESTWNKNPKGWGLKEINRERHERARNKKASEQAHNRTS
jgi:hypothetical protein